MVMSCRLSDEGGQEVIDNAAAHHRLVSETKLVLQTPNANVSLFSHVETERGEVQNAEFTWTDTHRKRENRERLGAAALQPHRKRRL